MKNLPFLLLIFCACSPAKPTPKEALSAACEWLWAQQSPDGGWHSTTHGLLKTGQSLTPFVLFALLGSGENNPPEKLQNALGFLRKNVDPLGRAGFSDPDLMDYPNYSTAYTLRVLVKYGSPADSFLIKKMTAYLQKQQFAEQRGIGPDCPAFGGWGFGEQMAFGTFGQVDLSHTRRALQALRAAGATGVFFEKSHPFFALLQKSPTETRPHPPGKLPQKVPFDGGFYYSPTTLGANKGEGAADLSHFKSYATATSDGLLAMLAAGIPAEDARVQAAFFWLKSHPVLGFPEGIPLAGSMQWHRVMKLYHLAVRAEAYSAMGVPAGEMAAFFPVLMENQLPDGSFCNPDGGPNKENDPLLATSFAVSILRFLVEKKGD